MDPVDLQSLSALEEILASGEVPELTMDRIARLALECVPGADAVSITVLSDGSPATPVATDERARRCDAAQYEAAAGPCLTAAEERRLVEDVLEAGGRWPEFTAAATAQGFRTVMSVPLVADGRHLGALNLYSEQAEGFSDRDEEAGLLFAGQATVALSTGQLLRDARSTIDNLRKALESRDIMGQAKGILMASRRITADEAWAQMVGHSQRTNTKVYDIAEAVVLTGTLAD